MAGSHARNVGYWQFWYDDRETKLEGNIMLEPVWGWAILGMILLGVEMLSSTFYILWFGIAALCVALVLFAFPATSFALQLLIFSMLSLVSLGIWKLKYQREALSLRVGQSHGEAIGETGQITETVSAQQLGRITFTLPVMGSRDWVIVSDDTIEAGSGAEIVGIEGNYLRVRSLK